MQREEEIGFDPSFMEGLKALREIQPKRQTLILEKKRQAKYQWLRNAGKSVLDGFTPGWRFSRPLTRDAL